MKPQPTAHSPQDERSVLKQIYQNLKSSKKIIRNTALTGVILTSSFLASCSSLNTSQNKKAGSSNQGAIGKEKNSKKVFSASISELASDPDKMAKAQEKINTLLAEIPEGYSFGLNNSVDGTLEAYYIPKGNKVSVGDKFKGSTVTQRASYNKQTGAAQFTTSKP